MNLARPVFFINTLSIRPSRRIALALGLALSLTLEPCPLGLRDGFFKKPVVP